MKQPRLASMALLLVASWSCHKQHIPESTTAPPGIPRVGWVIMSGDRDNPDDDYVCQSQPRTEKCVLPASRPDHQVFADVHFYFHPAASETKYTGTVGIGFLQGSPPPFTPKATVKAGDKPAHSSVFGIVSATPGQYAMTISVVGEGEQRREINEQIQVEVRAAQQAGKSN